MIKKDYIEALSESILIFDGAMGTNLELQNPSPEKYGGIEFLGLNEMLSVFAPEIVKKVHQSFLDIGVDVIETNTFRANAISLAEFGIQEKSYEINLASAKIAKEVSNKYNSESKQKFVAGSMGPTGKIISIIDESHALDFDQIKSVFKKQALGLIDGGVDLLLLETQQDLLEVKAAILGIKEACFESDVHVPIQVQVTLDIHGKMLLGSDIESVVIMLTNMGIDVLGINCSTGPSHMLQPVQYLSEWSNLPISVLPNAGMPEIIDGEIKYTLSPKQFSDALVNFVKQHNVSIIGGCCGTTPAHLELITHEISGYPTRNRKFIRKSYLSSPIKAVSMKQIPQPLIIGERLNTQGSRKFKKIIINKEYDAIDELAQTQVAGGAHALDICAAVTENDLEIQNLATIVKRISHKVNAALVIDSTDPIAVEAALKSTPGKCLINSTHFESGEKHASQIFTLAKKYNAAVIILTIDEEGMAATLERKMEIVHRGYDLALKKHGIPPEDLVFDPLTFSLVSGDKELSESAVQTLEAIKKISEEFPLCHTSLGISNVSFGLMKEARKILNSVFLYYAVQAGLDMAILHAAQIIPYTEIPDHLKRAAENIIFNKKETDEDPISILSKINEDTIVHSQNKSIPSDPGKKIEWQIINRISKDLDRAINDYIANNSKHQSEEAAAVNLLNTHLLPAMKIIGKQFGDGEIILPFVLQSSEIMRSAMQKIKPLIQTQTGLNQGKIVLATVYGDVHDIGKNLVGTILENNGFEVIDLGKQVHADLILETALEEKALAIGLSALLVNTSKQMRIVVQKCSDLQLDIPILIGGAAVNNNFAKSIELINENGEKYAGGVHYCSDAFEALKILKIL